MTNTREIALCLPGDAETLGTATLRMRLLTDANASDGAVSTLEVTMTQGADGAARTSTLAPTSCSTSPTANSRSWRATASSPSARAAP